MKIHPRTAYKLEELIVIILWWVVMVRVFIVLEFVPLSGEQHNIFKGELFNLLKQNVFAATYAGLLIGLLTGLSELFIFQRYFRHKPFRVVLLAKLLIYLVAIFIIAIATAYFYQVYYKNMDGLEAVYAIRKVLLANGFYHLTIIGLLLSLGINFILLMKNKIGYRIFSPILLGRYLQPKEENRLFLFIDLTSSTRMAENLGHKKYSLLIQQCFLDLSDLLLDHKATIYQFVGDEAVLTWKLKNEKQILNAIDLFFAFSELLASRSKYYQENFGILPEFKGAINAGEVMVAEVGGSVKSEIAFHGDVLNSAARMMELCNVYGKNLLVSDRVVQQMSATKLHYNFNLQGEFQFRGKDLKMEVYGVEKTTQAKLIK